jgi:hypothetical protein
VLRKAVKALGVDLGHNFPLNRARLIEHDIAKQCIEEIFAWMKTVCGWRKCYVLETQPMIQSAGRTKPYFSIR